MSRKDAVLRLVLHIAIGVVTGMLIGSATGDIDGLTIGERIGMIIFFTFATGGLPFGWKWLTNFLSARTIMSIIVKAFLSVLVGWIIYPVTLVKDIIAIIKAD